jgi:tRNA(fMet)-specific endonuclease VapC
MIYLLDTNVWVAAHRGNARLDSRIRGVGYDSIMLCAAVIAELYAGALKSNKPEQNVAFVNTLLQQYDLLYFGLEEAWHFAKLRAEAESRGVQPGFADLQIGATAVRHGLVVVTHDVADFSRIGGITLEDWQA